MAAPASSAWVLAAAGCFGWVWGSFLNTVVDRTPRRNGPRASLGWFSPPRSVCLACGAAIPGWDNVPIVSYLVLRGRCRSCGASIGLRTLMMEVATPLGFVVLAGAIHPMKQAATFSWGAAVLSVALVSIPVLLERRRFREIAVAWGLLAAWAAFYFTAS
ncbi:MAG TPA: prepilin peptidase [bacterium]